MIVRPATQADIPSIRSIAERTWPVCYGPILPEGQVAYMLELMYSGNALARQFEAGHRFLLIEEEGRVTGFASHGPVPDGPGVEKLHKLYVLPDDQRRGRGRALVLAVKAAARARGARILRLDVNRNNPAIGFYKRLGFSPVREQVTDIGGGFVMDDRVLELQLA